MCVCVCVCACGGCNVDISFVEDNKNWQQMTWRPLTATTLFLLLQSDSPVLPHFDLWKHVNTSGMMYDPTSESTFSTQATPLCIEAISRS